MRYRYSRWDGTQSLSDLDADELLGAMADDLLADGDLKRALRRLMQQGTRHPQGGRMPGLRDLMERLRRGRQERLDRYDLDSGLGDIQQKLERVIQTEREGIGKWLQGLREQAQRGEGSPATQQALEQLGADKKAALDRLPPDAAGRLRQLQKYDFLDPEARRLFEELLQSLRQSMLKPFLEGMQQNLQRMTPEDLARMREMIQDLNRLLSEKAAGGNPDFQKFRDKWGQNFPGVESLDQLLAQMGRQMAQLQSLMASLSPEQRQQLDDMMRTLLGRDERLEAAMAQLAETLGELLPMDDLVQQHPFRGEEQVTLQEAMRLMEELQQLDQLERELRGVQGVSDLERLRPEQMEELLGPEAARDLEQLQDAARKLEEAGYLQRKGDDLELTARAIRKIGDKALHDVFARLTRDRFGGHALPRRGAAGDQTAETKPYEFGDPFLLDLKETVMNAVERRGVGTPVRLAPDDFEVHRTESRTEASTVVLLDLSRSMINNGYFLPAKKVAMALAALIRGQFPRDSLHVVGFSLDAQEIGPLRLPRLSWMDCDVGTNMHAAFLLARRLLGRHGGNNRQIILITDGEPTAHLEGQEPYFAYPPSRRTLEATLREVHRCTREGITINTFMLERSPWLQSFVEQMARINRGRAFFASAERLGEYVLVDFVSHRRARRA